MYRIRVYKDSEKGTMLRFESYESNGTVWDRIRWLATLYSTHRIEVVPIDQINEEK